jgi:hypothetical protein
MKTRLFLFAILVFIHSTTRLKGQSLPLRPFRLMTQNVNAWLKSAINTEAFCLHQDPDVLAEIIRVKPETLSLRLPIDSVNYLDLNLKRYEVTHRP